MGEPGWWDITGGKLTTYRLMAEQAVDRVVRDLGCTARPCRSADEPLLRPERAKDISTIVPPPVTQQAVEHYCTAEWAVHLDDVMVRRTSWRHYHRDHFDIAGRVALWMAEALGWDEGARQTELQRYRCLTERDQ